MPLATLLVASILSIKTISANDALQFAQKYPGLFREAIINYNREGPFYFRTDYCQGCGLSFITIVEATPKCDRECIAKNVLAPGGNMLRGLTYLFDVPVFIIFMYIMLVELMFMILIIKKNLRKNNK